MNYIDRIKKIKSERKITNDKLSEMTGIPLGTLSKILAGISDSPKLSNIVAIADALECSLDYLVAGKPENNNNYTLNHREITLVETCRSLDTFGQELVFLVADKEAQRCRETSAQPEAGEKRKGSGKAKILTPDFASHEPGNNGLGRRNIPLYSLPVSAGPGVYLDESRSEEINIPDNAKTAEADFALRISGNSMEPKFHDGDLILVQGSDSVEVGEIGIFILDGNGYCKKYGGDRLISLNPEFGDILLRDYAENVCCGRVVGKLRKK